MSIFSVTNTKDSGSGSLRQAINDANTTPGFDIISFGNVFSDKLVDTITLSSSLQITDDLIIQGTGTNLLNISGNHTNRVFEISSDVTAIFEQLTVNNGYSQDEKGGGIYNQGILSLNNINISNNEIDYRVELGKGSGIYNSGTLTVINSTISSNRTVSGYGGGLYNAHGVLTVSNSTISENLGLNGGGGIYNQEGVLTINKSTITSNDGGLFGGGIYNNGTIAINDTIISSNITPDGISNDDSGGGGIFNSSIGNLTISRSVISGNAGGNNAGGIDNFGLATVSNSTINNNDAESGGGLANFGFATINNTTIKENTAGYGGGILNAGTLRLVNSTINNNSADTGGGISNGGGLAIVSNSTISSNLAETGGGIDNSAFNKGNLIIKNSTITLNTVYSLFQDSIGGGINNSNGTATVENSIIAGNFEILNNQISNTINSDVTGYFTSNGHNLINDLNQSTGFNTNEKLNVPITDVIDTTLKDNGGPTQTYALVIGSPAINAGLNADVPPDSADLDSNGNIIEPIPYDQRGAGFNRIANGTVDIGAYELQENVINGTKDNDTINGTAGNDIITGLRGRDILRGGSGADSFVYTSIQDLGDTITDFQAGTDNIVLRQLFGSLNLGNLDYASAIALGYLQFTSTGNNTVIWIDPDGTAGKGRAVKLVTVNDVSATTLNNSLNFAF